ncbi:MAG TPA: zinc ABC transporter substrate-binding protein [Acidimicrobiales bacterium]|nr:zinc ABC transporter substrate-binding protein [Acidimicrobiales bacterium]
MRKVLAALLVMAFAGACGGGGGADDRSDGRTQVVASFYPLFEAAQRVGGDRVQVRNLTPAGSEPHDLELNSTQVDRIEDAAVVLFLGQGFQPALEEAAGRARGMKVDILDELGDLLPAPAGDDQLDVDPHVWLDPKLFKAIVTKVADALSTADPANRGTYEANAAAYSRELDELDAAFVEGLSACERRVVVTSHSAFGYLTARYGLVQEAIAGLEPESEPSPQRLADLTASVRAQGTTTVFYETLVSPKVARSLAREAGVSTAVLDPIEGLSDDDAKAGKTYLSAMRENLGALRLALECR